MNCMGSKRSKSKRRLMFFRVDDPRVKGKLDEIEEVEELKGSISITSYVGIDGLARRLGLKGVCRPCDEGSQEAEDLARDDRYVFKRCYGL